MRRFAIGLALAALAWPAAAEDIVLRGMGSFHIGGRIAEVSGKEVKMFQRQPGGPMTKLDPNGQYMVEQMYVQYFLPKQKKGKYPLLMWHGGFLTGATYESTPDGREGWLNMFIRYGWDTYISDSVERGRSGFASADVWPDAPIFLTLQDPFERWRIGEGEGSWSTDPAKRKLIPGSQYPAEAYENFLRQAVPRWVSTDGTILKGYLALIDKVCPCVLLVHSQGGNFAFLAAEQRPDKIKGIVAVESATAGKKENAAKLKDVPVLMMFGDYVERHPRWAFFKKVDTEYGDAIKAAGGTVDWISLPDIGIKGNSHMLMHEKNNAEIAAVIQKWLAGKGLSD
jgi:pimeloyl-ACP methyl ester carboxylesterase